MRDLLRTCLVLATLLPLFSSVTVLFFGKKRLPGNKTGVFTAGVMAVSFALSLIAYLMWSMGGAGKEGPIVGTINWIPIEVFAGKPTFLTLGILVDGLTIAMMVMVTLISTLVHIYSIGYMHGDKRFERFLAYLSLFTFSMLGIVTANSVMQIFVFWELVGLTSYLLIGFWFEKRGPQLACKKAFVMNRIGDAGFLIGFGILFAKLGGNLLLPGAEGALGGDGKGLTSMFGAVQAVLAEETKAALASGVLKAGEAYSITNPPMWLTAAGIGLFFGAIGKSAQFPLQTWLPDAMEGPTPVSSIVHSATMVAAGVFMTARIYPLLTPGAHLFISTIGLITLVMAACMALVMTDIKRVLAYSTLSQLGYMILGLGTGNYIFAIYHLFTHAFFKCCLFQCAGSVIHAAHHQQDMRFYGGLMKKMPKTAICYAICTLAIAGASLPTFITVGGYGLGLSGFYSKDGIIAGAYNYGHEVSMIFFWGPTIIAYVTAFYMTRSFCLTFLGKPRDQHLFDHAHEAPKPMVFSQIILAAMAVISVPFVIWLPLISQAVGGLIDTMKATGHVWVQSADDVHIGEHHIHGPLLFGFAWIVAIAAGYFLYKDGPEKADKIAKLPGVNIIHKWVLNKFYFDALYDVFTVNLGKTIAGIASFFDKYIVDGLVNFAAFLGRLFASWTGKVDNKLVDGAVNGAAEFAFNSGSLLRTSHGGRVRVYVMVLFGAACLATIAVMTVVLVTRAH